MTKKVLITSALPYANGPLHFGHIAGAYLPGDCYARFERLLGNDVLYVCGSDEFGIAITLSADLAGRTPKQHVDIYHEVIKDFFKQLNLSFDHYSRTTWPGHVEPVQQFFLDLVANGFVEEKITDQLYSEKDKRFLADRYVVGTCPKCSFENARGDECTNCGASYEATDLINPRSKLTNAPLTLKKTKHWFLMLDKMKDRLTQWIDTKDWKPNVTNFVKGYIQELHPRSITRDSDWGIPVPLPGSEGKVLYVWFDAPIGYISSSMEWAQKIGKPDAWKNYWFDKETKLVNFIGKDNIPFHAVIFPAMVMGQNQPYKLVDELPANEFYNLEGRQFSKSDGWMIDLETFFKTYSSDQIRYTIAANAPETADSEFTWRDFQLRCNTDLMGKFGNLVNRTLVFIQKNNGGKTPAFHTLEPIDIQFLQQIKDLAEQAKDTYSNFKVRRASQIIMELAQAGNVYFDAKAPWKDAKQPETKERMETTLACCLQGIKTMALISLPIIPEAANKIWHLIGYHTDLQKELWDKVLEKKIPVGITLPEPSILFRKIEDVEIEAEIAKLHAMASKAKEKVKTEPFKDVITIDDVRKLDLKVGTVLSAQPVPKSKKLLQLIVDLGFEKRQVVAGVGASYSPEALIGKKIILVANLKPSSIMGVESQGMILAASHDGQLEVIGVQASPPGSSVS